MSPYLRRLDQEFRVATSSQSRGEIRARRAGYLARIGDFNEAKSLITAVRSEFGDGHSARVTILIIIAEALLFHYESLNINALDRIARAQVLSKMMGEIDLLATSSAWRAHFEFDHSKFSEMFDSLGAAINRTGVNNNEARARISNIVCKAALLCGDRALAKKHFLLGREFALKESDQASVEAIQHNKAAFRLSFLRASIAMGTVDPLEVTETKIEIASARSLQNLSGVQALPYYIDLCEARILAIEEKYIEAIEKFQKIRNFGPFPTGSLNTDLLDLETSFCYGRLGELDKAIEILDADRILDFSSLDSDEKLIAAWMRYQLAIIDSAFGDVDAAKSYYDKVLLKHIEFIDFLRVKLKELPRNDAFDE